MVESFRKQLDALMGANRNGDSREVKKRYYDRDVCKMYLAGLCPHDLFQLTKMDLGPCPKIHSLQLRKEYNEAKKDNYDRELEDCLEKHISECDRKIQRSLKRLEDDEVNSATAIAVSVITQSIEASDLTRQIKQKLKEAEYFELEGRTDDKDRVMAEVEVLRNKRADRQAASILTAFNKDKSSMSLLPLANPPAMNLPPEARNDLIKEKLKKAEELGEQGMVDEAQKSLEEAEALKKLARQESAGDPSRMQQDPRATDQKLRVCDICGAFLSIYDSDRRLADHFGGKLHLGYMCIRDKLADIREEREKARKAVREKEPVPEESKPRSRAVSRDRDRDYNRSRDRDRHNRERYSRGRESRDHDRGRSKSPSREPVRERSRDISPRERNYRNSNSKERR